MIEQTLKKSTRRVKVENIQLIYNLIFKNAHYSLECFAEGSEMDNNYCYIENFTEDKEKAERFLKLLAKGKVFPVHIKEIAEDRFDIK